MLEYIENIRQQPEGPSGRSRGKRLHKGGKCTTGLLEWTTESPKTFRPYLEAVEERLPTDSGGRAEEAHTLKINGLFRQGARTAIFYECAEPPIDLREVLRKVARPSDGAIRGLARAVATQVRSLHVHFQINHTALRTESFVFLGAHYGRPYVLDLARPAVADMYRHPEYSADRGSAWFYQVWALMMRLVTSTGWKSALSAQVFRHGFGILEADRETLETYGRWRIKRFYDTLCELLLTSPP
ncbi:hypothetical protein CIB48_g2817 [Xylaria polymorpha]|nr:hypothetical protein CIB48_g2817 [Xylaria polymorpha]